MSDPKYHHYVPRFYLSKFADETDTIWVYDKEKDKTFATSPSNIGGQKKFYQLDELSEGGFDPLTLEKQLADLEYQVSNIINDWEKQFFKYEKLFIPDINRELISTYIAVQLLRTVEAREHLIQVLESTRENLKLNASHNSLHATLLWNEELIAKFRDRISECIWIFGRNNSSTSFMTSDHPVIIKTGDNRQWLTGPQIFVEGMYVVFPLSPTLVMYCKDPVYWNTVRAIEHMISPVEFSDDMVNHENSGQVGMSYRFVFSSNNDFSFAKEFLDDQSEFRNSKRKRI